MSVGATGGSPSGGRLWEILSFSVIGVVSTVANLVLYAVFRLWRPVLVANLAALVLTTLFNTEANRRFTFAGAATSRRKAHVQGLVVFGLHHAFTSAALPALHWLDPAPGRALELTVLFAASVPGTAGRFVLLRSCIFRKSRGKDEE
ncbi:GtrA family protein [Amycolatopsis sp. Hca4]|uniref:GtrA family protein n=1 Tax=Amycolatopsis sp. Hca4 TaxID=2742131 RepID=UPI00159062A1|nr:GtrA family protein [Amycolatopsis sp. Hca4]QKV73842.1 GtrA family protein [Amycolatopsis sp. Hca4]